MPVGFVIASGVDSKSSTGRRFDGRKDTMTRVIPEKHCDHIGNRCRPTRQNDVENETSSILSFRPQSQSLDYLHSEKTLVVSGDSVSTVFFSRCSWFLPGTPT